MDNKAENKNMYKRVLLIIPAMILCLIGDYCIGIEPADSTTVSGLISTGWLSIDSWRIILSNICGMVGTFFYTAAALTFVRWLRTKEKELTSKADQRIIRLFCGSLIVGIMSFIYFHIACGMMIYRYPILLEATSNNTERAAQLWNQLFIPEMVPYIVLFVLFDVGATVCWILMIFRKIIDLPKIWIIASPLMMTCVGILFSFLPLPFNGIESGFESLGWMLMFICGARYIKSCQEHKG